MLLLHSNLNHWCLLVFGKIMNNMLFWVLYIDLYTHTSSLCCMVLLRTSPTSFLGEVHFFFQACQLDLPTSLQSSILIPTPPCLCFDFFIFSHITFNLGPQWLRWHHHLSGLGPQGLKLEPLHVENNLDTMCIQRPQETPRWVRCMGRRCGLLFRP